MQNNITDDQINKIKELNQAIEQVNKAIENCKNESISENYIYNQIIRKLDITGDQVCKCETIYSNDTLATLDLINNKIEQIEKDLQYIKEREQLL